MRVNRLELLQVLESVAAGLSQKEVEEQSSCFAFANGRVMTFNGELACWAKLALDEGIAGAVPAVPLLTLLGKLPEDELDISVTGGEFVIKGRGKRSFIRMEAEVLLPIDTVERPKGWQALPPDFCEAVSIVQGCAAKEDDSFILTCVNITPEHIEACDNNQLCRYPIATPIERDVLVRRESIKHITGLDMVQIAETKNWVHFRNPAKLILSCRRYTDEFHDLTKVLDFTGTPVTLPGGLADALDRAGVFSSENPERNEVEVALSADCIAIKGAGALGRHIEKKRAVYDGPNIRFLIDPKILTEISNRHTECQVTAAKLRVDAGKFVYVSSLGTAETMARHTGAKAAEEAEVE